MKNLLLALMGITMLSAASAQCADGEQPILLEVTNGSWPSEISWQIYDADETLMYSGFAGDSPTFCFTPGVYTFVAADSYGDGWNGATATLSSPVDGSIAFLEVPVCEPFVNSCPTGSVVTSTFEVNMISPIVMTEVDLCTDQTACNFGYEGDCTYAVEGFNCAGLPYDACVNPDAINYVSEYASFDNSTCIYDQAYVLSLVNDAYYAQQASTDSIVDLQAQLAECDSVAVAEVEYWMDNYYDAVAEGNALVDSLNAIISAVPATIEDIVDPLNAEIDALEDALADAEACCSSCPAAIETAVENAIADCEENNAGELMEVYYNGYAAGQADCEGEVSGLVDIDGTVINVIGYYNQLGQIIDPATATGVIIRKHDDGTFSKYFK